MQSVAQFEICYSQFLDENAQIKGVLPEFARSPDTLVKLYRNMVLTRTFDKKAISLQRTGQLGTYPSSLGQEAIAVAIGSTMATDDILFPYYREYGAMFQRGVSMAEMFLYWGGDERGMNYAHQSQDFPVCVPIASHATQAVGAAYAFKLRNQARVAVMVCGDGATSKGDFYEAINAAGVWQLPVVFVVNNNQWAISVPRSQQTHSETIAQKAIAAGFSGEQVDGNDIIAMHFSMENALRNARSGAGAHLIEALSYRLCDHTTADDASRYRSESELQKHWQSEPIARFNKYLCDNSFWDDHKETDLQAEALALVEQAVETYLNTLAQELGCIFDFMFEQLPPDLAAQKKSLLDWIQQHG